MFDPWNEIVTPSVYGKPARPGAALAPPPELPGISPAQEESLLSRLGQKALSGLGYFGQVMDKTFGGRAVRGALGGNARELLSIIPLSDTLHITNEEDIMYGRPLLEKWGVLGKNEEGLDAGDVAGFAAELALDPSIYMSLGTGAVNKFGLLAKKFGALPKSLHQMIRGHQYAETALEGLRPVAQGLSEARHVVAPGATIAPKALLEEYARQGLNYHPQFQRTEQALASPLAGNLRQTPLGTGLYGTADPLAAGSHAPEYGQALHDLKHGTLPPIGKYSQVSPHGYEMADVGVPKTFPTVGATTPIESTAAQFVDTATKKATPLAGLVGIGLPFAHPSYVFGTGEKAAKFAELLGHANDWVKATAPVRYARALVDPTTKGVNSLAVQELAGEVARPLEKQLMADTIRQAMTLRQEIEPLVTMGTKPEVDRLLLRAAEGVPMFKSAAEYGADLRIRDPKLYHQLDATGELGNLEGHWGQIQAIGDKAQAAHGAFNPAERARGMASTDLAGALRYVMRQREALPLAPGETSLLSRATGKKNQSFPTGHSSMVGRDDLFAGFPEGTSQINDAVRRRTAAGLPVLVGPNRTASNLKAAALLRRELTKTPGQIGSGSPSMMHFADPAKKSLRTMTESEAEGIVRSNLLQSVTKGPNQAHEINALVDAMKLTPRGPRGAASGLVQGATPYVLAEARAQQRALNKHAIELADYFKTLPEEHATVGHDYFTSDPTSNLVFRGAKSAHTQSSAATVMEALRRHAAPIGGATEGVSVADLLRRSGLDVSQETDLAGRLARKELGVGTLDGLGVSPDIAADLTKFMQPWNLPEEVAPLLRGFDQGMNLWKGYLTAPFPAFHARNVVSGLFNALRDRINPYELFQAGRDAKNVIQGRANVAALPGMAPNLSKQAVLDEILKESAAHNVAFLAGSHRTGDTMGSLADDTRRLASTIPGRVSPPVETMLGRLTTGAKPLAEAGPGARSVAELMKDFGLDTPNWTAHLQHKLGALDQVGIPAGMLSDLRATSTWDGIKNFFGGFKGKSLNPLNPENVVLSQGRAVGETAEDGIRLTHYLALRKQGYHPAAAADMVHRAQILYSDVTPFERNIMKRLMPFYTFSSRNVKNVLGDLATQPAHLTAGIRLGTGFNDPDTFVPPYLREGSAIAIGGAPDGSQRYISSLGMPFEDEPIRALGSLMARDPRRAAASLLSGSSPLLKYPAEVATGVQMSSGRRLEDLNPSFVGRNNPLAWLDPDLAGPISQLIAQTPVSRVSSTVDKLTDTRKGPLETGLNLGTGVKVTDVDANRQKEIATRDIIQDVMRGKGGVKTFESLYVKPENLKNLSEEELLFLALYRQLERNAQKAAALKKKQAAGQAPPGVKR